MAIAQGELSSCFGRLLGNRDVLAHVALLVGGPGTLSLLAVSRSAKGALEAEDDVVFLALRNALLGRARHNGLCCDGGSVLLIKAEKILEESEELTEELTKRTTKRKRRKVASPPKKGKRKSRRLRVFGGAVLRGAHAELRRNCEYAHDELSGVADGNGRAAKNMTLMRLRKTLRKWAPLRCDHVHPRGSTILMECVRTRRCSCRQALMCARELLEKWQADPNVENPSSRMRAIHYCAARGMPKVVKLLLDHGAAIDTAGKGTFTTSIPANHMVGARKRRITGNHTPLEWARAMKELEIQAGVGAAGIRALNECIRILENVKCEK